jgi:DNA-binding NarL/FixJ family response regulator
MIRVMIVDDHAIARTGLRNLVMGEPDFAVCCEVGSSEAALAALAGIVPDMCIIDISLPDGSGLELTAVILRKHPRCRILVVSAYDADAYAPAALKVGALGYVAKDAAVEELTAAIRCVGGGEVYGSAATGANDPAAILSEREREILRLIGGGLEINEIAATLARSAKTIDVHRQAIKQKMAFSSNAELQAFAVRWRQVQETGSGSRRRRAGDSS